MQGRRRRVIFDGSLGDVQDVGVLIADIRQDGFGRASAAGIVTVLQSTHAVKVNPDPVPATKRNQGTGTGPRSYFLRTWRSRIWFVLAVAPTARFGPDMTFDDEVESAQRDDRGVAISPDGLALKFHRPFEAFVNYPQSCLSGYYAEVDETKRTVAVSIKRDPAAPAVPCDDNAMAPLDVPLKNPLGNRILVDADRDAVAIPVLPCGQTARIPLPRCEPTPSGAAEGVSAFVRSGALYGPEFGPVP